MAIHTTNYSSGIGASGLPTYANDSTGVEQALKVFSGEVLTAFEQSSVFNSRQMFKRITSGESSQFMVMGRAVASHRVKGVDLISDSSGGSSIETDEEVVLIDRPLKAHTFVDRWDEAIAHYESRSKFAMELGRALARVADEYAGAALLRGANATHTLSELPDGYQASSETDTQTFGVDRGTEHLAAAMEIAAEFDSRFIPEDGRKYVVPAKDYWCIVQNKELLNRDFGNEGNGVFYDGIVYRIAGMELVKHPLFLTTDYTTPTGARNLYDADFADPDGDASGIVTALSYHESALGTVRLWDVETMVKDGKAQYGGDLLVAELAQGTKYLRPEACAFVKGLAIT